MAAFFRFDLVAGVDLRQTSLTFRVVTGHGTRMLAAPMTRIRRAVVQQNPAIPNAVRADQRSVRERGKVVINFNVPLRHY